MKFEGAGAKLEALPSSSTKSVKEHQEDSADDDKKNNQNFNNNLIGGVINILNNFHWYKTSNIYYTQKNLRCNSVINSVVEEEPLSVKARLEEFPVDILMVLFSYLDVVSLCKIAQCSQKLNTVANDNLLWQKKLKRDSQIWEVIDHVSHPKLHIETSPEVSNKEIYLRCCPNCQSNKHFGQQLKRVMPNLSFYFGFSIPKVVMFGSGLDNSGFVKSLLWDKKSPFTVKQMFPGQFDGIGSGFTLQHSGGSLNLITLYGMSKAEREAQKNVSKERKSKLLVNNSDNEEENAATLSQPLRELCSTVDAFIYVVNGSDKSKVNYGKEEFKAMLDLRWVKTTVPVLILCMVPNASVKGIPPIDVADELEVLNLSRPWQIRQLNVETLHGLVPGVNWFTKRIMCA